MKKIKLILILAGSLIFLVACSIRNSNGVSSSGNNEIKYNKIVARFQNQTVEITNQDDIEKLKYLFNEDNYKRNPLKDGGKGWTYELTASGVNEGKIIYVLNENSISIANKVYDVEGIDLKVIDSITGIDRYKSN